MKRFFSIVTIIATLVYSGCLKSVEKADINDLQPLSGISNHKLMLDGSEGSQTSFSFRAKHDWQIIDYKGFTCDPSSGNRCGDNESITVTATTLQSNNTADTVRLSDLNFKLLSTRFVGISAYQLPRICLPHGNKAYVDAAEGSTSTFTFISKAENISITTSGEIEATLGNRNSKNEYSITIKAKQNNNSPDEESIGTIEFIVDGMVQDGKIEVIQIAAIRFDRTTVLLPGKSGASNMFAIDSKFDIEVSTTSELFSISEMEGNEFLVTATADNTTAEELLLGEIVVSLTDAPDCRAKIDVRQRKATASQTIIAKFVGTALQYPFNDNIASMLNALNGNIQGDAIILAIYTESTTDATLYELRYDSILGKAVKEKVKELSLPIPYDAALFEANLREAIAFAPAEKYALIIGSHGLAWIPKNPTLHSIQLMKMGISSPSLLWEKPKGGLTRHIGDGNNVRYDISEIATAIEANDVKLEYILFDACFMGNIETAYELRKVTKHIIASPCEVMGAGFPYKKVLPYMLTENGASYNLDKVCSEYVEHYRSDPGVARNSACVSITHTAELEALAAAMKEVNTASVKEDFSLSNVQIYDGVHSTYNPVHKFYDLGDMVEQSCSNSAAVEKFKIQIANSVTSLYHTDRFFSDYDSKYHNIDHYSGLSTSAMVDICSDMWQQTAWYKATH